MCRQVLKQILWRFHEKEMVMKEYCCTGQLKGRAVTCVTWRMEQPIAEAICRSVFLTPVVQEPGIHLALRCRFAGRGNLGDSRALRRVHAYDPSHKLSHTTRLSVCRSLSLALSLALSLTHTLSFSLQIFFYISISYPPTRTHLQLRLRTSIPASTRRRPNPS